MKCNRLSIGVGALIAAGLLSFAASGENLSRLRDYWIHPRGETYDPKVHYRAPDGELYYHTENDLGEGLDAIVIHGGSDPRVSAHLGSDILGFVARHRGSVRPMIHYDTDGDGRVDRSLRGSVQDGGALFTQAQLNEVDWRHGTWQMGILYVAGADGAAEYDRRYLASVDSETARVKFPRVEGLPPVAAGGPPGLLIYRHHDDKPIDLAALARNPGDHLQDFDPLTRLEDTDDWRVKENGKGRLRTHFEREDLFLVRTSGDATLDVIWGNMPLQQFLDEKMMITPDADGCYSSMESQLTGDDGEHAPVPHRILYCPEASLAVFDAPDGYQIYLSAMQGEERLERTMASTSILDNVKLYAQQVYPRSPKSRATGSVGGNVKAGFADAGDDVVDMGRNLVTGTSRTNVNTGQVQHRTSLLAAVPMFFYGLGRLEPAAAFGDLFEGIQSGAQVAADSVSAVNNAVLNPVVQGTVGIASTGAADSTGHWMGALTQAWAQNLPGSERSTDAISPISLWHHNRAFAPVVYTRTDTQLNIDRVFTALNIYGIYALSVSGANADLSSTTSPPGGGGTPTPTSTPTPPPPTPTPTATPTPTPTTTPNIPPIRIPGC